MTDLPTEQSGAVSTVSVELVADWIDSLRRIVPENVLRGFLDEAGMGSAMLLRPGGRVTQGQIVALYRIAAVRTGDEMMGLWSRPVRSGTLKFICRAIIDAPTLTTALHRLTQVWNLMLDDYRLSLESSSAGGRVSLLPRSDGVVVNRFAHALMLKLIHGIVSWLAGSEVSVAELSFGFARPGFSADYDVMFPVQAQFDAPHSSLTFHPVTLALPIVRTPADVRSFLERAPQDWIFTASSEHALALRVRRRLLSAPAGFGATLGETARHLAMSERSLTRRLAAEGETFHGIKDALRRDMALRELGRGAGDLEALAALLGYSAAPVFHRSFRRWTGMTPTDYRRESAGGMARGAAPAAGSPIASAIRRTPSGIRAEVMEE